MYVCQASYVLYLALMYMYMYVCMLLYMNIYFFVTVCRYAVVGIHICLFVCVSVCVCVCEIVGYIESCSFESYCSMYKDL